VITIKPAGSDLQIYHDGSDSIITDTGTGNLIVKTDGNNIQFEDGSGNDIFKVTPTATNIYHGTSGVKLQTTSTGIDVTGNATFADNGKAIFGAGSDLQIYHDGSTSFISDQGSTGNLKILAQNFIVSNPANTETMIAASPDGAVSLYYDAATKLATTSTGIDVTGDANFGDNDKAIFGAGSDLQIYHDGSHSYVSDQGTGNIKILADDFIVKNAADTETMIQAFTDSAVSLWYDNSSKLATTSTGVDVTGTVTADGLTVDGDLAVSSANSRIRLFETDTTDLNTQLQNQAGDFNIARLDDDAGGSTVQLNIDHATGNVSIPSGNVGIGTTSPSDLLELSGSTAQPAIRLTDSDVSGLYHRIFTPSNTGLAISADTGNVAADSFIRLDVDGTERMRIDSSGRVGIGTSSPSRQLHLSGSGANTRLRVENTTGSNVLDVYAEDGGNSTLNYTSVLTMSQSGTERMRIDSSGNLLVGTTTLDIANNGSNTGFVVNNNGAVEVGSSSTVLTLNKYNDGDIIRFQKDGALAGVIGTD
jgi:hypothetical protein